MKPGNRKSLDLNIQTMRGLAIILLVAYHVIGSSEQTGIHVNDDSFLRFWSDVFSYVRMPLFTYISGYVYGLRPFQGNINGIIKGKARRLLIPMFFVGTTFVLLQSLVPDTNYSMPADEWVTLHIYPVAHFWFVEALFIIFLVIIPLERFNLLTSGSRFVVVLIVVCVIHLHFPYVSRIFSLNGAIYLFPYFLIGLASYRFKSFLFNKKFIVPLAILFLLSFFYAIAGIAGIVQKAPRSDIISLVVGAGSAILLLHLDWHQKLLVRIGYYSYSIYIFHVFATASMRISLNKMGFSNSSLLLVLGVFAGIIIPIIIEHYATKLAITRTLLLGKRWSANKGLVYQQQ